MFLAVLEIELLELASANAGATKLAAVEGLILEEKVEASERSR